MTTRQGGRRLLLTMSPEELQQLHAHRGRPRPSMTEERALAAHQRATRPDGHHRLTNAQKIQRAQAAQEIREAAAQVYGPHGRSPRVKRS